jgi:DNA-binding response OmpR family regulator
VTTIDTARRTVCIGGAPIRLPALQFAVVAFIASRPGVIRSRVEIMDHCGIDVTCSDRAVDDHVRRARRAGVTAIQTYRDGGYFWKE